MGGDPPNARDARRLGLAPFARWLASTLLFALAPGAAAFALLLAAEPPASRAAHLLNAPIRADAFFEDPFAEPAGARAAGAGAERPMVLPARAMFNSVVTTEWTVLRERWSRLDAIAYEDFIRTMGRSDCASVHECFSRADANTLYRPNEANGHFFEADCADFPYLLRAYFSWRAGLPFSHAAAIRPREGAQERSNETTARRAIASGADFRRVTAEIRNTITTEHFRTPAADRGPAPSDHYPVRVSRGSIRPGTILFDPSGHVATVYDVTPDGRVLYFDAHPDNTVTRGVFSRFHKPGGPEGGGGFKRWRPQTLTGARRGPGLRLEGGDVALTPDEALSDWSDEQFRGQPGRDGTASGFEIRGAPTDYHGFVRLRLAPPGFRYDPPAELRAGLEELCRDLQERVLAVDAAIQAGMDGRPAPPRLPDNIFATDGDWQTYATAARDARMRSAFVELRDETVKLLALHDTGSPLVDHDGPDLRAALRAVYRQATERCAIRYRDSGGALRTLAFEEARRRLFLFSFDPHHCVERRWGATSTEELGSCGEGKEKAAWYEAQAPLRNLIDRSYGARMGWTLAQLSNPGRRIGALSPPGADILSELASPAAGPRILLAQDASIRPDAFPLQGAEEGASQRRKAARRASPLQR